MAIFDQFFTGIIDEKAVTPHETKADPTGATWLRSQRRRHRPVLHRQS